jgi:hypothetical protein
MAQMPKFLEDYTTVDELISKMNKEYPECRLIAEMIGYGDDWVIFKSSFYETKEDTEPKAVAYAKQTSKDHNSWFEMANTKANGRCLRIVFSESTLAEEMIGIAPSKDAAPEKFNLDKKVEALEAEGLVTDISHKAQAVMNSIKDFAMDCTAQDLDKARLYTASALTELGIRKEDVSITNLQAVKDKIQDIASSEKAS